MPTLRQALDTATPVLQAAVVDSPRLNAELLLAHVLRCPRLRLLTDSEREMAPGDWTAFEALVRERARRRPLQHLIGSACFLGHEIEVSPDVLVPRPETEVLAQWAIECAKSTPGGVRRVLDFGAGSGCLAIALAAALPEAEIHAIDISPQALVLARRNAVANGVSDRIRFHEGDGFWALRNDPAMTGGSFDLIVSNPPYIASAEIGTLQPEVRDHDPRGALDGGADGLDFYRRLAVEGAEWLVEGGRLLVEFGDGQGPAIADLFAKTGKWRQSRLEKDLSARERVLIVQRGIGTASTG